MKLVSLAIALLSGYLAAGLCFALLFVLAGVQRIDPHAAHATWGFRVLLLPGATLLWPLLARRWLAGQHEPPPERNAHRLAAGPCTIVHPTP